MAHICFTNTTNSLKDKTEPTNIGGFACANKKALWGGVILSIIVSLGVIFWVLGTHYGRWSWALGGQMVIATSVGLPVAGLLSLLLCRCLTSAGGLEDVNRN